LKIISAPIKREFGSFQFWPAGLRKRHDFLRLKESPNYVIGAYAFSLF
jgi:hypothetical protein